MKKDILLLTIFFVFCSARAAITESERDQKIDRALFYHYSGKPSEARKEAEELRDAFPREPFFRELVAEILWQELSKSLSVKLEEESASSEGARDNPHAQYLAEKFKEEIFAGLILTQESLRANPDDVKSLFLRAMLKLRYASFIVKFESGWRSYAEPDREGNEAFVILNKCLKLEPPLCSVKYTFALSKHILIKAASDAFYKRWGIAWKSKIYETLGGNFNQEDVFLWLEQSMACNSGFWWTKDVEIDKKLVYQDILVQQAGRMDSKVLPMLEELSGRFPDNKTIRDNLFLVRLHLKNKKSSSR